MAGAVLLVGADIVSQGITIRPPFPTPQHRPGLPVGAVMAFIGAPFFNVQAHISVSPIDGALLCHPYAALPEEGDGADTESTGPAP